MVERLWQLIAERSVDIVREMARTEMVAYRVHSLPTQLDGGLDVQMKLVPDGGGVLLFHFSDAAALALAGGMMREELAVLDDTATSALAELVNVILGHVSIAAAQEDIKVGLTPVFVEAGSLPRPQPEVCLVTAAKCLVEVGLK